LKYNKRVLFASAKSVDGADTSNIKPYILRILLFLGAFPYPVVIKILTFL